jgi:hypothetical protein
LSVLGAAETKEVRLKLPYRLNDNVRKKTDNERKVDVLEFMDNNPKISWRNKMFSVGGSERREAYPSLFHFSNNYFSFNQLHAHRKKPSKETP